MIDTDRRNLVLMALLSPLSAAATANTKAISSATGEPYVYAPDSVAHWTGDEQIGMLIYPGMTIMDLIGPQSMFASLMGAKIYLVAKSLDPVTSDADVTILPTATFDTCPRDLTVLFTPGGTDGTLAAASDPDTLAFMADRGARAKYITSVCSGSLVLGAAGLLDGYKATSHWSCRDALSGFGAIPIDARVVRDRNRFTGAGVTAGLDFALAMVAELRSRFYAECTQLMAEYDPQPPFNAGSVKTAPAKVVADMTHLLEDFTTKVDELVAATAKKGLPIQRIG
ncbi:DJ-1/PfpI family protein [Allopusillimonas ginsengisoli]|uniref:DJ-1/PfpI family protein n=1 Tax=Allopusillimonas ginsengisoli TaxID=453575 RepID=UPI001021DBAC|nr:DJ-1/PfpI family protein [Allopusillimonas ginsengisoli]TEA77743.1 DJ-1/PfpI family protein [Allopusillimonas ginsengisoli]